MWLYVALLLLLITLLGAGAAVGVMIWWNATLQPTDGIERVIELQKSPPPDAGSSTAD